MPVIICRWCGVAFDLCCPDEMRTSWDKCTEHEENCHANPKNYSHGEGWKQQNNPCDEKPSSKPRTRWWRAY